eukprot:569524-Hanusia_phi.AAC.1
MIVAFPAYLSVYLYLFLHFPPPHAPIPSPQYSNPTILTPLDLSPSLSSPLLSLPLTRALQVQGVVQAGSAPTLQMAVTSQSPALQPPAFSAHSDQGTTQAPPAVAPSVAPPPRAPPPAPPAKATSS